MADINKFSEQVIDLAERLANVADAAKGKDTNTMRPKARWVASSGCWSRDLRADEPRLYAPGQDRCR